MLGKLSVPGRPTSLDDSRARAYCACTRCGWGFFLDFFSLIYLFSFLSPSLWEKARYRLKYCLKGPLNPKQPTNQSRSHPRHLVGKRTAQKDTTIDTTSDSQVNSNLPNRRSPASLTFNNYFYLFLYFVYNVNNHK